MWVLMGPVGCNTAVQSSAAVVARAECLEAELEAAREQHQAQADALGAQLAHTREVCAPPQLDLPCALGSCVSGLLGFRGRDTNGPVVPLRSSRPCSRATHALCLDGHTPGAVLSRSSPP